MVFVMKHVILLILLVLSACGFRPIYGDVGDQNIEMASYLTAIEVESASGELGNRLKIMVEDQLNPAHEQSVYAGRFKLVMDVKSDSIPLVIRGDGSIDRFSTNLVSSYHLYETASHRLITSGTLRRTASYNNLDEKFASYIAQKDALHHALGELAEDYKLRLAGFFASQQWNNTP